MKHELGFARTAPHRGLWAAWLLLAQAWVEGAAAQEAKPEPVDQPAPEPAPAAEPQVPLVNGSHIRRPRLTPDDALVIDSPLSVQVEGRDYLQMRRQLGGVALPDATGALGLYGPGTSALQLRLQPTLILLNGRRLISAPSYGINGADYVDLNQLPISLIERVETTRGMAAGLYGDGAIGGVVNFITRRDFDGVEVEVGGQATDDFDQYEGDVTMTVGAGSAKTGMTVTGSYFNRQPLAATDTDWISAREARLETLFGGPASYQQLTNFDYPFPDPYCDLAQAAGHSTGLEVRLRGYGPPETLGLLPPEVQQMFLNDNDVARGDGDGVVEALETATYCAGNFTPQQDVVIEDERYQTYLSFWHEVAARVETFGELGFYRTTNANRTAAAFPITHSTVDAGIIGLTPDQNPLAWVPPDHADQPVHAPGFSAVDTATGRVANNQFIVGRVLGPYAEANTNRRRLDVWRGVLGLRGDFSSAPKSWAVHTWDWELSSLYSQSAAFSSAKDVMVDKLAAALNACQAQTGNDRTGFEATTITQRQNAGCYNPFYSSITNDPKYNPLNVAVGASNGNYICDPSDPNSPPCPDEFDQDGDGTYELAGTTNTNAVLDRLMGEHTTVQTRALTTVDGVLRGDLLRRGPVQLGFSVGAQYRRESIAVDYDAAYNQQLYGYLYGAPDVPTVKRNIAAVFAELRPRLWQGLVELQLATRLEYFDDVGTAVSPLGGVSVRPFAAMARPPAALEWLLLRGHVGRTRRPPSLAQLHGGHVDVRVLEFYGNTIIAPHLYLGNPALTFETYTTASGGLQWDYLGIHIGADYWKTWIGDAIATDNSQTLLHDCEAQYQSGMDCPEQTLIPGTRSLDHLTSAYDNLAEVETDGIDGLISYTLDTKKRSRVAVGTFVVGFQPTFINSYLIRSPRALREYYRPDGAAPSFNADGSRGYDEVVAEYEAAGYRNVDNFAFPMPRLRFSVPVRWMLAGHMVGATVRHIGSYNDDSEHTIERYGLPDINDLAVAEGETIPSWTVLDLSYGYTFGVDSRELALTAGVINVLDTPPPEVDAPLGYDWAVHDPRGRMIYLRARGKF